MIPTDFKPDVARGNDQLSGPRIDAENLWCNHKTRGVLAASVHKSTELVTIVSCHSEPVSVNFQQRSGTQTALFSKIETFRPRHHFARTLEMKKRSIRRTIAAFAFATLLCPVSPASAHMTWLATDYLTAALLYPAPDKNESVSTTAEPDSDSAAMTEPKVDSENEVPVVASKLADLPEELTSFGAAIAGQTLFVYGGHTGSAHSYSRDEQSNRLWSLDLSDDAATWQTASTDDHLQGLALLGWKDRVIRIGGFTAVNAEGEDHNLQSQKRVAMFDPATKSWTDLAPLPEARSSLDAAVLGDRIYVFGGWELAGDSVETTWHKTAYSLNLSDADATWQELATPPFQRRANSVAAYDGKLFVIGGMKAKGGPTTRVDVYDPASNKWSLAPSLPGKGMSGFGSSAFAVGNALYVSTMDGFVHRLTSGDEKWTSVAETDPARFFHRMIPWKGNLLMIGGANMQIGKFTEIEMVKLNK